MPENTTSNRAGVEPGSTRDRVCEPIGDNGHDNGTETVEAWTCSCGAGEHPELAGRCAAGHVREGNTLAVVTGSRSAAFWKRNADVLREISDGLVVDQGVDLDNAPGALVAVADGLAQSILIRDAAFQRIQAEGGPMSSSGKARASFRIWKDAHSRVESHAKLLGLKRLAKHTDPMEDLRRAVEASAA